MAEPLVTHRGIAAPLMIDNVDTDQIIPSTEMTAVSRSGLSDGLFARWRYEDPRTRTPNARFILNRAPFNRATILVSGENFGCGSSREHAVWALSEFGIRAILAASFGAIFQANCSRNGIVPIALGRSELRQLAEHAATGAAISIDLSSQIVSHGDQAVPFEIDVYAKRLLLEGLDPIGLTLSQKDVIERFIARDRIERPWVYGA